MNRILILIAFLASPQLYADPYETAQRFTAGDVISAEVLNDILDRIELSLKEITVAELVGTWTATQHVCNETLGKAPGIAINADHTNESAPNSGRGCLYVSVNSNYPDFTDWDGATGMEDGLYGKRTDTITITAVSGSDTAFTIQSENYNFIYRLSSGGNSQKLNSGLTHKCAIIGSHGLFGCLLDAAIVPNSTHTLRRDWITYQMRRLSPTRFEILGGPSRGNSEFNLIVLDKTDVPPEAPTALSASRTAGTVTLSWTVNGSTATGGVVKRKTSIAGSWSTLGTPSTGSYSDSAITLNNSYWYRVFATNANGTSVGSNVVKVTWANTPPLFDFYSHIDIYENTTAIVSVGATDVDGDALTYSISSQSPGSDATYMSITSGGVLSFDSAPDYENPQDYGTNNTYEIKVTISDGIDPITRDLSVSVMNVSD